LRINLVGNILNWAFIIGGLLREKGHEARVFVDKFAPESYQPRWEFPELKEKLPDWVQIVDVDLKKAFVFGTREREFIRNLGDCDIIQAFGEAGIWAGLTQKPFVYLSYGADLDLLPFNRRHIKGIVHANLLKEALKKSSAVLYAMPPQKKSVEKLNLVNARFFPRAIPIDTDRYRPFDENTKNALRAKYKADFIFFHPARQEWTCQEANNKGNDRLFKAFAKFVKDSKKKSILIAVEKGRDVAKSKQLVHQLNITENVEWIKPVTKHKLIEILNTVDICFDQFVYGSYGISTLEALSVGVPTFLYLSDDFSDEAVPPVVNVESKDDIYVSLTALMSDKEKLTRVGKDSRDWVLRHHQPDKVIASYIDLYKELLGVQAEVVA